MGFKINPGEGRRAVDSLLTCHCWAIRKQDSRASASRQGFAVHLEEHSLTHGPARNDILSLRNNFRKTDPAAPILSSIPGWSAGLLADSRKIGFGSRNQPVVTRRRHFEVILTFFPTWAQIAGAWPLPSPLLYLPNLRSSLSEALKAKGGGNWGWGGGGRRLQLSRNFLFLFRRLPKISLIWITGIVGRAQNGTKIYFHNCTQADKWGFFLGDWIKSSGRATGCFYSVGGGPLWNNDSDYGMCACSQYRKEPGAPEIWGKWEPVIISPLPPLRSTPSNSNSSHSNILYSVKWGLLILLLLLF